MNLILSETGDTSNLEQTKKRGRQPKKENYFDVREELAVERFLVAESWDEKNKIYNDFLRKPIDKMISSIIRRYKLYRKDMEFEEIHADTHSFLMTKVDKFKPDKNKKAYSYFGTICKNYLMGQIIKDQKEFNRKVSYEDVSLSLESRPDFVYYIDQETIDISEIMEKFLGELSIFLKTQTLNTNEERLGYALYELFENYNTIFIGNDNNKFNKNIILLSLREMTNLSTKEIRSAMKKYKKLYVNIIQGIKK